MLWWWVDCVDKHFTSYALLASCSLNIDGEFYFWNHFHCLYKEWRSLSACTSSRSLLG